MAWKKLNIMVVVSFPEQIFCSHLEHTELDQLVISCDQGDSAALYNNGLCSVRDAVVLVWTSFLIL